MKLNTLQLQGFDIAQLDNSGASVLIALARDAVGYSTTKVDVVPVSEKISDVPSDIDPSIIDRKRLHKVVNVTLHLQITIEREWSEQGDSRATTRQALTTTSSS
jgi:hypothetical protein